MAGVAADHNFHNVLDLRLIGININQDDMPWWGYAILIWVSMVRAVMDCQGENGPSHRAGMRHTLEKGRPEHVYKLYESYALYHEAWVEGRVK